MGGVFHLLGTAGVSPAVTVSHLHTGVGWRGSGDKAALVFTVNGRPRRGALLKVLDKPHLDLTTPIGRGFIAFLSALAEDERGRIVKRANDGRTAAKARGAVFGRKPKLNAHQQREALKRLDSAESARAIGKTYDVHHATISRLRCPAVSYTARSIRTPRPDCND